MENHDSCKKGKTTALLSGSGAVFLSLAIIGIGFLVSSFSGKSFSTKSTSLRGSVISLIGSDSLTIKIANKWQLIRIPIDSWCRLEADSGAFQVQFIGQKEIFEKDWNNQWWDKDGPITKLPDDVIGPNFRIRSATIDSVRVKISTWPKLKRR